MSLGKGKDQLEFAALLLRSRGTVVSLSDSEYEQVELTLSRGWDALASRKLLPVIPRELGPARLKLARTELGACPHTVVKALALEDRIIDCVVKELVPRCAVCGERAQAPTSLEQVLSKSSDLTAGFIVVGIYDEDSDLPLKDRCEFYGSERAIVDDLLVGVDAVEGTEGDPVLSVAAASEMTRVHDEVGHWFSRGGGELRLYHFLDRRGVGRELGRLSDRWRCSACKVAVTRPTRMALADMPDCPVCRGSGWIAVDGGRYHACRDCDGFGSLSEFRRSDFHGVELRDLLALTCSEFGRILTGIHSEEARELAPIFGDISAAGFAAFPLGASVDLMSFGERALLTILAGHLSAMSEILFVLNGALVPADSLNDLPELLRKYVVLVAPSSEGRCDEASVVNSNCVRELATRMPTQMALVRDIRRGPLTVPELRLPIGGLTAIQGAIGSGKSLLLREIADRFSKRRKLAHQNSFGRLKRARLLGGSHDRDCVLLELVDLSGEFANEIARLRVAKEASILVDELSLSHARYRCPECGGMGRIGDHSICSSCDGALYDWQVSELSMHGRTVGEVVKAPIGELINAPWCSERVVRVLEAVSQAGLSGRSLNTPASELPSSLRLHLPILAGLVALAADTRGRATLEGELVLVDGVGCVTRAHQERLNDVLMKLCDAGATIVYANLPKSLESICASVVGLRSAFESATFEPAAVRCREPFLDTRFARSQPPQVL